MREITDKELRATHERLRKEYEKAPTTKTTAKQEFCDRHGQEKVKYEKIGTDPWVIWRCPECSKDISKTKDTDLRSQQEEHKEKHIKYLLSQSNIPERYKNVRFITTTANQKKALSAAIEILAARDTGIFIGKLGTGKTLLACNIIEKYIKTTQKSAKYSVLFDIIGEIKDSWNDSRTRTMDIVDRYAHPDLLVIDEVGMGYGSDTELIYISRIIDRRYNDMKKTTLCGNVRAEEIKELIGDKAFRRIEENCVKVVFDWKRHIEWDA